MTNERAIAVLKILESEVLPESATSAVFMNSAREAIRLAIAALREKAGKEN